MYCTRENVLSELSGMNINFTNYATVIDLLIERATAEIDERTNNSWESGTVLERISGSNSRSFIVKKYPMTSVEYVKIYDGAETLLLTLENPKYVEDESSIVASPDLLVILNKGLILISDSIYLQNEYPMSVFPNGEYNVVVKYSYGSTNVPVRIAEACALISAANTLVKQGTKDSGGLNSVSVKSVSKSFGAGIAYEKTILDFRARADAIINNYISIGVD